MKPLNSSRVGIGMGFFRDPESRKILSEKSRKFRNPGNRDRDIKASKKVPKKPREYNPEN